MDWNKMALIFKVNGVWICLSCPLPPSGWHQLPCSPSHFILFMLFMALGAITCLVTLTRARLDSKAVLPNSPSHTYTHHRNSHTQAIRAHLSTFKHAHIHYTLPMHSQWTLFIVGIYLPACSSVCVYSCERRWACSPHRPALRSGDFVSNSFSPQ